MDRSFRSKFLTVGLDVVLVISVVAMPGLAYWYAGPDVPGPQAQAPLPDLALVSEICAPLAPGLEKQECYLDALRPVLFTHGIKAAFTLLEELARANPYVGGASHPLAHALAQDVLLAYPDPVPALIECPVGLAAGCLHGILESYLEAHPDAAEADLRRLCPGLMGNGGQYFQCLHGIGHGVTMALHHDLFAALQKCDLLADPFQRESCYGGVFMENAVSWGVATGLFAGDGELHVHSDATGQVHNGTLDRGDIHYPCNAVDAAYVASCYSYQTSVMLMVTGFHDPSVAATGCLYAPPEHLTTCFFSFGRDVSPMSQWRAWRAIDLCGLADDAYEEWCVAGVVKDFVNQWTNATLGLDLCRVAKDPHKALCYQSLGEIFVSVFPHDAAERYAGCEGAEPAYVATCRTYAGT